MKVLWRISNHCDLAGLGGEKADGRWHTAGRGKRIVYLSEHPALALLEVLANLKGDPKLFPNAYQLMKVRVGEGAPIQARASDTLSSNWRENAAETRLIGDTWLEEHASVLLEVPASALPESLNYLFNPTAAGAQHVGIEWCRWVQHDRRLFRNSGSDAR